ncbi:interferon-induced transmembrane protein 3-like isoform X2 [Calypte anna]|uniref:interferon-induced transmembrane protein 3-like isoform X2 n=1 Tax=Calypte anna TaxID=9244 RepID=UPI0011C3AB93|nr:interferon-induced transmembrane protein 3-like isoform X2 [Calypte anna]
MILISQARPPHSCQPTPWLLKPKGGQIFPQRQWEPVPNAQDFVLWSFFNAMFCNPCCLGFVALVYSIKARDKKIAQDPAGAVGFGRTAKQLNIAALCLGLIFFITIIVLAVLFRSQNPHGV